MSYLKCVFRATKEDLNLDRSYELYMCKGLFDSWLVITAYGRYGAGQGARPSIQSFFELEEAKKCVKKIIKKRLHAMKRIGCNYEIIKCSSSDDLVGFLNESHLRSRFS
jgi:hypothetical protein